MKKEEKIRAYTYALDNINREIADDVPSNGICWYLNLYAIAINENSGHYESFFKTYPELLKYAPNVGAALCLLPTYLFTVKI